MASTDISIIILAAGKGTRMRSDLAKVLHRAGGRPLIEQVIRACQPLRPAQILAVVGHQAEAVTAAIQALRVPVPVQTVLQQPQRGTGHAIQVARRAIRKSSKLAVVLPGDAPLLRAETLAALVDMHRRGEAAASILSAELADPSGYGRIVRDAEGRVQTIVEDKALSPEQRDIREVNSSIYCFTLEKLWPCLAALRPENAHHELYLTDAIALLRQRNERVLACVAADPNEVAGCNTRGHLADADRVLRARKAAQLMDAGATIYLPETVVIDPDVTSGPDTVIEPGVRLLGNTRLGARCQIGAACVLIDMRVDDDAIVFPQSHLVSSRIGAKAMVGPFSRLRPGCDVRPGAHVGTFVEMKNTTLHERAKAPHLSYLGDATIGADTNIGAGTITCNYDGSAKYETKIGKRVFVGSDSALVAPVRIGDGAYVAAGSVITDNVPADALAIARGRQSTKLGWARQRRRAMKKDVKPGKASHVARPRRKSRRKRATRRR
ncbi:MAG TPA: bifunctional UDP-N-acetylglucosamine diphosphorylase/glucosamine-1-phosphate N-acetyltransferase GlmU [Candidatus Acidoferrales bacterium]|nr:bifunctional UDP-N-acetylglucosamine diphosphorylase/glucosamine-1-phosphate N-acetyltransferase GlmU [Candidatus Acidoferrales bacterium]